MSIKPRLASWNGQCLTKGCGQPGRRIPKRAPWFIDDPKYPYRCERCCRLIHHKALHIVDGRTTSDLDRDPESRTRIRQLYTATLDELLKGSWNGGQCWTPGCTEPARWIPAGAAQFTQECDDRYRCERCCDLIFNRANNIVAGRELYDVRQDAEDCLRLKAIYSATLQELKA